MENVVIVRYGELPLKSKPVRSKFKKKLIRNIKSILGEIPSKIETERGRIFIKTPRPEEVSKLLAYVPGIVSSSPAKKTKSEVEEIVELSKGIFKEKSTKKGSFAVRARRTGNHEFSSQDLKRIVGSEILKENPNFNVNLDSPDYELYIEVRGENAYIFTKKIRGIGGLPAGTQGKVLVMYSKPINALVSSYLMLKRGATVYPVIFSSKERYSSSNVLKKAENILKIHPRLEIRTVEYTHCMEKISEKTISGTSWIISQKIIFEILEKISEKIGAKAIISDSDIDQIASISLDNIRIIEKDIEIPVFYPLIGIKKKKISEISEKILGEKISEKTPTPFKIPSDLNKVHPEKIQKEEKKIPKESLIKSSLKSIKIQRLRG